MSDTEDPRIAALSDALEITPRRAARALAAADAVDPLRALLANDGKAIALIDGALRSRRAVVDYDAVAAVLAALREVQ